MREMILKAVANPPKILWGPFLPTLMNLGMQFPLMFISMGIWNVNPIFFMASIALGHILVVYLGQKDPHISTMIMAFGQSRHISNNIYKSKGNKFAP